jgi:glycosyltransferase involved in cell wall biosynthesis
MKKIVITGYSDRNDGPSVFVRNLSSCLSEKYDVKSITNRFFLKELISVFKADSVLLNSCNLIPFLVLLLKPMLPKKKYISIIHGELGLGMKLSLKKILLQACEYLMIQYSDRLVFVSSLQMNQFVGKYGMKNADKKCRVVFNGVDVGELPANFKKEKLIVYVGGENEKKGREILDSFIESFSSQDIAKEYQLCLYGMCNEKEYTINNLRVVLKRKIPHDEIITIYKKSEIFLSLSEYETFGIACVEAYCLGNKIVCYKDSGFLEAVNDDNVFVVDTYRSELFCFSVLNAIKQQYLTPNEILSTISMKYIMDKYINLIEFGDSV